LQANLVRQKQKSNRELQLAAAMNTSQGQISRIERLSDMLLSTLAAYLTALGVEAQIVVEVGGQAMTYDLTPGRKTR